ncbi:hypothetical protein C7S17_4596 [Burkholderia thailandensis]|nr:hypothetical protein [Burkholderia thailandensis]
MPSPPALPAPTGRRERAALARLHARRLARVVTNAPPVAADVRKLPPLRGARTGMRFL